MIYGYARVSTDGQSVAAQVAALRKHGAGKVFREVSGGAFTAAPVCASQRVLNVVATDNLRKPEFSAADPLPRR